MVFFGDHLILQVKKKMSLEDFIRNNRQINDGEDLSGEFLSKVFSSIRAVEIKMSDEAGIDELSSVVWDEMIAMAQQALRDIPDESQRKER